MDATLAEPAQQRPPRMLSTIFKHVSASWLSLLVGMAVSFIMAPITVNALGNVYYGIWTLIMQFTGYLWLFDFGVRESVVKYVAQHHAAGEKDKVISTVRTAVSIYGFIALMAMVGVTVLTFALPHAFNIPPEAVTTAQLVAFLTGATIAQSFIFNVFVGVVLGIQRYYRLTPPSIAVALVRAALTYVLLTNGYGIVALAVMQLAMSGFSSAIIYFICRQELPYLRIRFVRPTREEVMKLFNYAKFVLLANLGDKIVFSTDSIVIATFLPVSALTFYAIGGSLIEYFRTFIGSMSNVINPLAASLEARNDAKLLNRLFVASSKAAMLLGLPICIGFIFLGERFLALWMGPAFAPESGQVLAVLAVGYMVGLPYRTIASVMYGLGQHKYIAYSRLVEGAFNLALSVVLIKRFGILGVAIGTAIPHAISVGCYLPFVLPKMFPIDLREYFVWTYVRPFVACLPFAGLCWYIEHYVQPAGLITFMASVAVALVTYIIPSWFLVLTGEERRRAMEFIGRRVAVIAPPQPAASSQISE